MRVTGIFRRAGLTAVGTVILMLWPGIAYASVAANWPMTDVGSPPATMTDTSGHNHNGNPSGGVVGNGSVFTFDGTGVVVVPDGGGLDPGTRDVSVTAVIRFTRLPGGDYDVVRKKPAGVSGPEYRMEITGTGKAKCFFTGSSANSSITARPKLNDGNWHTIVCAKTATAIRVTVDGKTTSKNVAIGSISNQYAFSVGAKASGGDNFIGSIDKVTIDYS